MATISGLPQKKEADGGINVVRNRLETQYTINAGASLDFYLTDGNAPSDGVLLAVEVHTTNWKGVIPQACTITKQDGVDKGVITLYNASGGKRENVTLAVNFVYLVKESDGTE